MSSSAKRKTATSGQRPVKKASAPKKAATVVWVVTEGERCDDTGSDFYARYPDNADVSVVGVCSSLRRAQQLALSRMEAKGIEVTEKVGDNWTELVDESGDGGLTSPCGAWSVSIEQHIMDGHTSVE